jgi:hypothetical protein
MRVTTLDTVDYTFIAGVFKQDKIGELKARKCRILHIESRQSAEG